MIIARTDAVSVAGFEDAVARCHKYVEAGADMVFFDGIETREQLEEAPKLVSSDLGQPSNPSYPEGLASFAADLESAGIPRRDLIEMLTTRPAGLLTTPSG